MIALPPHIWSPDIVFVQYLALYGVPLIQYQIYYAVWAVGYRIGKILTPITCPISNTFLLRESTCLKRQFHVTQRYWNNYRTEYFFSPIPYSLHVMRGLV